MFGQLSYTLRFRIPPLHNTGVMDLKIRRRAVLPAEYKGLINKLDIRGEITRQDKMCNYHGLEEAYICLEFC